MSEAPADLLTLRAQLAKITGSPLGDIGIAADSSHLASGGYHCGAHDLHAIDAVGRDDYSIRQPRDRTVYNHDLAAGANWASAMDYPDDWPRGGRAAWLRFNNNLRARLGSGDPALIAIRGMNYSPDGTAKRRYDCLSHTETASTDTVTWHTHIEWWRDTFGLPQRRWATERLCDIAEASVRDVPVDQVIAEKQAAAAAAASLKGEYDMQLVTCTDGSGTEKSINETPVSVPVNGRVVITPAGPWSCSGAVVGGFDLTYWKNTLQLKWSEIKELCNAMRQPAELTDAQTQTVAEAAGKGAHDAINGATGTLTLSAADTSPTPR